jgi:hypothetical protein
MSRTAPLLATFATVLALGGCAQVQSQLPGRWPWLAKEVPQPVAVHELDVVVAADAAMPIVLQYWERNTLVLDLQGVASAGELILKPRSGVSWPVRIAFRVAPGRFQLLEVSGAQRVLLPVSGQKGAALSTLPLAPSAYAGTTAELRLRWGAADAF